MPRTLLALLLISTLAACAKPTDIVLGPKPLEQMAEQGERFRALPEGDRALLAAYMAANAVGLAFGMEGKPIVGRTVGEVLVDARAWKAKVDEQAALKQKFEEEAAALKAKVEAERKATAAKIEAAATLVVVDKRVLPEDSSAGRYSPLLMLTYAIENKGTKAITQIKGEAVFRDATGDKVGALLVDIDKTIAAGQTIRTDLGRGWRVNSFMNGDIQQIARHDFALMKVTFEPSAIAFADGEVIRAPE